MSRSYRYLHLDVFTGTRFGGNQLAVFLDGRGLSAAEMQAIARELNLSESTFVLPAEQPGTDVRVRIFTPAVELPIAGHPTIGTAFALAADGAVDRGRSRVVFGLGVGPTPVDLTWTEAGGLSFAWMTQPNPTFGPPLDVAPQAAEALSLPLDAVEQTKLPLQIVSCGVPYLIVPVATRADVDAITIDSAAFARLADAAGLGNTAIYVFTTEPGAEGATVYTRMFGPQIGIAEDPATGSAAGPLGCYLVARAVIEPAKAARIVNLQGVRMGRPSLIHTAIAGDARSITGVRVGGEAVLTGEGRLYV